MLTYATAMLASASALLQASDEGLTFGDLIAAIPTDPASVFTLLLLLGSVALVLWYGRPRGGKGGRPA